MFIGIGLININSYNEKEHLAFYCSDNQRIIEWFPGFSG